MNGVEILNEYEVVVEHSFNLSMFWLVVIGAGIIGLIIGIVYFICNKDCLDSFDWIIVPVFVISMIVLGLFVGTGIGTATKVPIRHETHYEVLISENVNMLEFTDKYEIIEQRSQIFVVREKTK